MAKHNNTGDSALDWRDRAFYRHTGYLTDRGWAWEGLRRNREFQDAWLEANPGFEIHHIGRCIKVVNHDGSQSGLRRWGILYSDSPHMDASSAAVVWQTEYARALNAVALPVSASLDLALFRLSDTRCSALLIQGSDGYQHVLFHCSGASMQLRISGASVLQPVHLLTDAASHTADLKSRLRRLAQFKELRTTGRCEFAEPVPKARADRLRLVLQALDGFLEGATLREIAIALFGAERVERDWDDDHRHLKDRARRAVARGKWLMEGGYKTYLK